MGIALLVPLLTMVFRVGDAGHVAWFFRIFGAQTPFSRLAVMTVCFAILTLGRVVTMMARDIATVDLQTRFVEARRLAIVHRLVEAEWHAIAQLRQSRIAHLMSGDIQRLGLGVQFLLQVATTR